MASSVGRYIQAFSDLHTGKIGDHLRPHKPVLLLAVLDLFEAGDLAENRIEFSPQLIETFAKYFEIVRAADDQPTPVNPFFYMKSDGFWHHKPGEGMGKVYEYMKDPKGIAGTKEIIECAYLDDELFEIMKDPAGRAALREAIVGRYFAGQRDALEGLFRKQKEIFLYEEYLEEQAAGSGSVRDEPDASDEVRDAAFSNKVRRAYDYRCAACGLRVLLPSGLAIVDAAHLVPWSETHDNDPKNGMALCKNHHWALDRYLIAPGLNLKWRVSKALDDRIEGQKDLIDLGGRGVLLPAEMRYHPKEDGLRWRVEKLLEVG